MGRWGLLFFGEKDSVLVEEIAKLHKLPKDVVKKHYEEMLEGAKNDLQNKVED